MDAGVDAAIDAPPPDAPQGGGTQTLSQTTSGTDSGAAIACGDGSTYTAHTSYYRVFPLAMYGITGAFNVSQVDFPVSSAVNGPTLKVTVGTYTGTTGGMTLPGTITAIATANVNPASTDTSESVPITAAIPAGSNLAVEVDQTNEGNTTNKIQFYIGGNTSGESVPGYISSPAADCNVPTPTSMTQESQAGGGSAADLILTVTGST